MNLNPAISKQGKDFLRRFLLTASLLLLTFGLLTGTIVEVRLTPVPELLDTDMRAFRNEYVPNWPLLGVTAIFLCFGVWLALSKPKEAGKDAHLAERPANVHPN